MAVKPQQPTGSSINILLLGETGVGKSTWVNAFVNSVQHRSLHDAETGHLHTLIPTRFTVTNSNFKQVVVSTGTHPNEVHGDGEAATQNATVYAINYGANNIHLIDTPGIGDPRGEIQDFKNLQNILSTIANFDKLHGICILLKPNNARLTVMFRYCIMELLTHLHKDVCQNIVFCFTNTRGTFYRPGDTLPALQRLLNDNNVNIPLQSETIYCFDSESYRFLAAVKNEPPVRFSTEDKTDFSRSWEKSKAETSRMLDWIATLKPHPIQSTLNLNYARELVQKLTRPLAEISRNIQTNKVIAADELRDIEMTNATIENLTRKQTTIRTVIETEPLPHPNTVCSNPNCCKIWSFEEHKTKEYTTVCHENCHLGASVTRDTIGDPALMHCWAFFSNGGSVCKCGHMYQEHLHIYYKSKQVVKTVEDEAVKEGRQKNLSAVQLKEKMLNARRNEIREYEDEQAEIQRASVRFAYFLKANAITPYNDEMDKYLGHLIKEEKEKAAAGGSDKTLKSLEKSRAEYAEQKKLFVAHLQKETGAEHKKRFSPNEVQGLVRRLKNLKHAGASLNDALKCVEKTGNVVYRKSIVTFKPQQQQQAHVNKGNERKSLVKPAPPPFVSTKNNASGTMTATYVNGGMENLEIRRSQTLLQVIPTMGANVKDKLEAYSASVPQTGPSNQTTFPGVKPNNTTMQPDPTLNTYQLKNIIIGTPECPYSRIVTVFSSTDTFTLLEDSWSDLARWLNLSSANINRIRSDLQRGYIGMSDTIERILLEWKSVKSYNATLLRLLNILEENNQIHVANCIRNSFQSGFNEN